MLKKVLFAVLALSLFGSGVLAGTVVKQYKTPRGNIATVEKMDVHKGRVGLVVNGEVINEQTWYADSVTYVPLRSVAQMLGAKVEYNNETMTAEITSQNPFGEKVVSADSEEAIYEGKQYKIIYPKNLKEDMEKTKKYVEEGIKLGKKIYDPQLPEGSFEDLLNNKKMLMNINLITSSNHIGTLDALNMTKSSKGFSSSEIEIFAPSISVDTCCSNEGANFTEDNYRNTIIHEVLHSFQSYIEDFYRYESGWYPEEEQEWAKEGLIEYYSRKQTGILEQLKKSTKSTHHTYEFTTDSFKSSNMYIFGPLFFDFLIQNYGEDKVVKLLHSTQPTAAKAFKEVYGMDLGQAGSKFSQWLKN